MENSQSKLNETLQIPQDNVYITKALSSVVAYKSFINENSDFVTERSFC